jgi:hypothetical protein
MRGVVLERVLRRGFSAWAHAAAGLAISVIFGWLAIRDVSWGSVRASLEHIRVARARGGGGPGRRPAA